MLKRMLLSTAIAGTAVFGMASAAHAQAPEFGSCLNPQWSVSQVNHSSNAQHGVIGVGSFAGTDTIYKSGKNVLQCLCTPEGKGYQTNWMSVEGLSSDKIKVYENEGWIYLATGTSYGLDDSAYLAKNIEYTCTEVSCTPTPTVTGTVTPTPTGVGATSTPAPTEAAKGDSAVQNAVTTLANTGNMALISSLLLAGAASLLLGLLLKRFSK